MSIIVPFVAQMIMIKLKHVDFFLNIFALNFLNTLLIIDKVFTAFFYIDFLVEIFVLIAVIEKPKKPFLPIFLRFQIHLL